MITGGLAVCLVLPNMVYSTAVLIPGLAILAWRLLFDRDGLDRAERVVFPVAVALIAIALANTGPVYSWFGIRPQLANFITGLSLILLAVVLGLGLGRPGLVRGPATPSLQHERRLRREGTR
jgi:Sec-independent protein secretion pathway component TatC